MKNICDFWIHRHIFNFVHLAFQNNHPYFEFLWILVLARLKWLNVELGHHAKMQQAKVKTRFKSMIWWWIDRFYMENNALS